MREALLASLAAALLAPVIRALAWRVPLRFLGGVGVRAALGAALVAFVGSGLAAGLLPAPVAGTVGFVLATLLALVAARRRRGARGLAVLALRLADPGAARTARGLLLRRARRLGRRSAEAHLAEGLAIGLHLSAAGDAAQAEAVLTASADREGPAPLRAAVLLELAELRLRRSDFEGARDALNAAPPAADTRPRRALLEAHVAAVLGDVEGALAGERTAAIPQGLAAAWCVVRAHALACRGDDAGARHALEEAQRRGGDGALQRALRPVGPATDLARTMAHAAPPPAAWDATPEAGSGTGDAGGPGNPA